MLTSRSESVSPMARPEKRMDRPAEICLMEQIVAFFAEDEHGETLVDLLSHKFPTSLRVLDRFISRWARFNRVRVKDANGRTHDLYTAYKCALRSFHRQYFDPFARTPVIEFFVPSKAVFVRTTLAQLNYIRWVIRYGALTAFHERGADMEAGSPTCDSV